MTPALGFSAPNVTVGEGAEAVLRLLRRSSPDGRAGRADAAAPVRGSGAVQSVRVEPEHDRVIVVLGGDSGARSDDLLWSLRMLGFERMHEHVRCVKLF